MLDMVVGPAALRLRDVRPHGFEMEATRTSLMAHRLAFSLGSTVLAAVFPLWVRSLFVEPCRPAETKFVLGTALAAQLLALPLYGHVARRRGKAPAYVMGAVWWMAVMLLFLLYGPAKVASGLALFVVAQVLDLAGYRAPEAAASGRAVPAGALPQPESVLFASRALFSLMPVALAALGVAAALRYPLTAGLHGRLRRFLAWRRGEEGGEPLSGEELAAMKPLRVGNPAKGGARP